MAYSISEYIKSNSTPIIDGDIATFVWKGRNAPRLVGDFTGWDARNVIKMAKREEGLWTFELTLPQDAYIEYGFRRRELSILDPNNPRTTSNGVGGFNNYFSMPAYRPTSLVKYDPDIPHGAVTRHDLHTNYLLPGNKRTVHLYKPPINDLVPLVIVWDGQDYLKRMKLNIIVDNLIHMKRIKPLALAFVDNGGQRNRTVEYACSDATLIFLLAEVIPLAKRELNLIDIKDYPGTYGVLGASMGGLISLYTGIRLPQIFGNVLSQSGAFAWAELEMVVFDLLQRGEKPTNRIWLDVGTYDLSGLLDVNRRMKELLELKGCLLTYHEYHAGHNYPAWRDDIWRGLEALYGS